MIPDLTPLFNRYEQFRAECDRVFQKVATQFPTCVTCQKGCCDCCYALFDLSLIEALYLNRAFNASFQYGAERSAILSQASEIDRKVTKIKHDLFRAEKNGQDPSEIVADVSKMRLQCPLLAADKTCILYEARPITCRLYGIPLAIGPRGHVCGFSAFEKGQGYPTVHLDKIQERLAQFSQEVSVTVKSRFSELHEVYVPLSMALLTNYDERYLGIGEAKPED